MNAKDLLTFLFQRADATLSYWTLFETVSAAVLGYVAAAKVEWLSMTRRWMLTLVFGIFAGGNYYILDAMRAQREGLIALLRNVQGYSSSLDDVVKAASPPTSGWLLLFHLALDGLVIAMIWAIPHVRRTRKGR